MPKPRRIVIKNQQRIFDDFFKIDTVTVAHEQHDGAMSADQRRLVFERGDAVAALLLDVDTNCVVLVDQFKVPTLIARRRDNPTTSDGWITEAVAGMVDGEESPEDAVIRECREETGYQIRNPRLIATFFSSPGGTSERIFLYFARVRASDRTGPGGGLDDEDVQSFQLPLDALFDRLESGILEDPKLIIAAFWLRRELAGLQERERLIQVSAGPRPLAPSAPAPASGPLRPSTTRYAIKGRTDLIVGYKTGPIKSVVGVDLWVNSENTDMMMDRFISRSISAQIRWLGANKDENGNVVEDTIAEALRSSVGQQAHVKIGTVLVTESGMLWNTHRVYKILHLATVQGGPDQRLRADLDNIKYCAQRVLAKVDVENSRLRRLIFKLPSFKSILIPMIGSGDGGLSSSDVAYPLISAAVDYFTTNPNPSLKEIYFIAYAERDKRACDLVMEQYCADGALTEATEP